MQVAPLSKTHEVAQFIDDDQFGFGQSVMKCGYEAVALFWHSVQVGKVNPYKASDVHSMASADYVKFTGGPDNATNVNGMSNSQLYADLEYHRFFYRSVPLAPFEIITAWLKYGYPVILGVTEDSVYDLSLRAKPYNWNTSGYTHIILATGTGQTGVLVRDTANVESPGIARPGPREYDHTRLHLISATLVVPGWLPNPPQGIDPRGTRMPPIDLEFEATPAERQLFELGSKNAIFNPMWAIVKSWIEAYRSGLWYGIPLEGEQEVTVSGVKYKEQAYSAALARWNESTGVVTWAKP